jgi:hypothetical protein
LVIVDFAPHHLDFLRDEHAHQRLGFADADMEGWFAEAELEAGASRTLAAGKSAADQLTVKIWVAQDRRIEIAEDDESTQSPLEYVA